MEIMKKKKIIIITEQQAKILVDNLINESQKKSKLSKQKCPPMAGILSELYDIY
jgi:polyhydroxyalkanoate synthesis regulator phasin